MRAMMDCRARWDLVCCVSYAVSLCRIVQVDRYRGHRGPEIMLINRSEVVPSQLSPAPYFMEKCWLLQMMLLRSIVSSSRQSFVLSLSQSMIAVALKAVFSVGRTELEHQS